MSSGGSLLVYLEVPNDCKDAIQLMDLRSPHFAKCMRRTMKKLEKNGMCADIPLTKEEEDGSVVASDFTLTCYREAPNADVLFARLPNGEGGFEICQLSFMRLAVKRLNPRGEDSHCVPVKTSPTEVNSLDNVFQQLSQKLDNIDSTIQTLFNSTNKKKINQTLSDPSKTTITTPLKSATTASKQNITPKTSTVPSKPTTTSKTTTTTTPLKPATAPKPSALPKTNIASSKPGVTPSSTVAAPSKTTNTLPKAVATQSDFVNLPRNVSISSKSPMQSLESHSTYVPNEAFLKSLDSTVDSVLLMVHQHQDSHFQHILFGNSIPVQLQSVPNSHDTNDTEKDGNLHITYSDLSNHLGKNQVSENQTMAKKRGKSESQHSGTYPDAKRMHYASDMEQTKTPEIDQSVQNFKRPWYYGLIDTVELDDSVVLNTSSEHTQKKHKHKHKKFRKESE